MTNYYLKTIHVDDERAALEAMTQFLEQEIERHGKRLDEITDDDGHIPEDQAAQWSQAKGALDATTAFYGLVSQRRLRLEFEDDND